MMGSYGSSHTRGSYTSRRFSLITLTRRFTQGICPLQGPQPGITQKMLMYRNPLTFHGILQLKRFQKPYLLSSRHPCGLAQSLKS